MYSVDHSFSLSSPLRLPFSYSVLHFLPSSLLCLPPFLFPSPFPTQPPLISLLTLLSLLPPLSLPLLSPLPLFLPFRFSQASALHPRPLITLLSTLSLFPSPFSALTISVLYFRYGWIEVGTWEGGGVRTVRQRGIECEVVREWAQSVLRECAREWVCWRRVREGVSVWGNEREDRLNE